MSTLLWFILILVVLGVVFRLFGRQLLTWSLRMMARQAMRQMQKQSEAYNQHFNSTPFEERVRTRDGQELHIPKKPSGGKGRPKFNASGEEVEYEEI